MSRRRRESRIAQLKAENTRFRAKLVAAHDHLHNNRLNELHHALHCESCDEAEEALSGQNISAGNAGNLSRFASEFNRLCAANGIHACWTALIPSAVKPGYVSVQMGGAVEVLNWVRREMGKRNTLAIGDH